eukprot:5583227-Amphidinium_carterae.1
MVQPGQASECSGERLGEGRVCGTIRKTFDAKLYCSDGHLPQAKFGIFVGRCSVCEEIWNHLGLSGTVPSKSFYETWR